MFVEVANNLISLYHVIPGMEGQKPRVLLSVILLRMLTAMRKIWGFYSEVSGEPLKVFE